MLNILLSLLIKLTNIEVAYSKNMLKSFKFGQLLIYKTTSALVAS